MSERLGELAAAIAKDDWTEDEVHGFLSGQWQIATVLRAHEKYSRVLLMLELERFVADVYGPKGPAGDGVTWRCGMMADLLALMLKNAGLTPIIKRGTCNGVGHVWVEVDGAKLDSARGQFDTPVLDYIAATIQ